MDEMKQSYNILQGTNQQIQYKMLELEQFFWELIVIIFS